MNVFPTAQNILQEVKYSLAVLMCAQQWSHNADSIYAVSRTHHLEIWSLYTYMFVKLSLFLFRLLPSEMPWHVVWHRNTHHSENLLPVFRAEERQCTLQKKAACYSERLVPIKQTHGLTQTGSMNEQLKHVNGVSTVKTGPCRSWAVHITLTYFRFSSVWIFQSILSFSRVKQYGRSLVIQSSIF
jgi:hypothetical protein